MWSFRKIHGDILWQTDRSDIKARSHGSSREADLITQTGSAIQHLNYMLLRQVWRLCAVALTVPGIWIPSMAILNILHSCQSRHQIW